MIPTTLKKKVFQSLHAFSNRLAEIRNNEVKIVFTNGCFDIIHPGHIHSLFSARAEGNFLVVGLNTDQSVKRLKGDDRPVKKVESRAIILAAFSCVDAVVFFDEDTPMKLIKTIKPEVLVKGADYEIADMVGAKFVEGYGGKIVRIPILKGFSTTGYLKKSL